MNNLLNKTVDRLLRICFAVTLVGLCSVSVEAEQSSNIAEHATSDFRTAQTLVEQPSLQGVEGNFFVPLAAQRPPPIGEFSVLLWQPNPFQPDGMLVPTAWSAGDKTGFYPTKPVSEHQSAFRDIAGSSTVQIDGGTVGAYLNAADVSEGTPGNKMMFTPQFRIPKEQQVKPFNSPGTRLITSLQLQIPTAIDLHRPGSKTYVVADLLFEDKQSHTFISYGTVLFFNDHPDSKSHIAYDSPSHSYMINSPLTIDSNWTTMEPGSTVRQGYPWLGWRLFKFSISENNFRNALFALRQERPDLNNSMNPADYLFTRFHLNAELTFGAGPTELGWSMRNLKIYLTEG